MRISDWSSDVCSSDLALAGEVGGQGEGLLDVLLGQHVGAGGHVAHEGHVAYGTPVDRRTGGGVEAHFDGAGLGVVAAQEAKLLEGAEVRSEEHTSELQSLMRISYAVFCLKKKKHMHSDAQ